MTQELIERSRKRRGRCRCCVVITTFALVLSFVVAFTVVSIGIARADPLTDLGESGGGRFALAVVLALVIAGTGLLTAMASRRARGVRRD